VKRFLLAITFVLAVCVPSQAQIGLDTSTDGLSATATSLTWTHISTGSNLILYVGFTVNSSSDIATGVTYNTVGLTRVNWAVEQVGHGGTYLYRLVGPASGSHSVIVSLNTSVFLTGASVTYTGADQGTQGDPVGGNKGVTNSGTSLALSVTTTVDNDWVVAALGEGTGNTVTWTNATEQVSDTTGARGIHLADTNGVVHPAGAKSFTGTMGAPDYISMVMEGFVPFTGGVTCTPTLSLMGVGRCG
jgi:hypothetical protein